MNPAAKIESVRIRGFRSLADVEFPDLPNVAVLIGANGSGKSNFLSFLEMVQQMLRYRRLGDFVARQGGADDQLFGGSDRTAQMDAEFKVKTAQGKYDYRFTLNYAHPDNLLCAGEKLVYNLSGDPDELTLPAAGWAKESKIAELTQGKDCRDPIAKQAAADLVQVLGGCAFYHFHNTGDNAGFKQWWDIADNNRLRPDGGNLAAVLYRLEREDVQRYDYICRQIQQILPAFDRFDLAESCGKILLRWKARGTEQTLGAHLASAASLRFFALTALLYLPEELLPSIVVLDEPELGLHPMSLHLLGGMIRSLSGRRQVILTTQSPRLVDAFTLDQLYLLGCRDGETEVRKLHSEGYEHWLKKYNTGELWDMNLFGGSPWSGLP